MSFLRNVWTESEVLNISPDEHGFLERKAGRLFDKMAGFRETMAKTLSAFANTGGGHIVLGQRDDDDTFDGLPSTVGKTPIREWLEQTLPAYVSYPLDSQSFRVHRVLKDDPTLIPPDREVIVVDVGDSQLAPHQAGFPRDDPRYYYRPAGISMPAPHHHLELLRNRITHAVLDAKMLSASPGPCGHVGNEVTLSIHVRFEIKNVSRIGCRSWGIQCWLLMPSLDGAITTMQTTASGRPRENMLFPTCSTTTSDSVEITYARPPEDFGFFLDTHILPAELEFCMVTEHRIGEMRTCKLRDVIDLARFVNGLENEFRNGWKERRR